MVGECDVHGACGRADDQSVNSLRGMNRKADVRNNKLSRRGIKLSHM
jgi:hypothetical protein